MTIGKAPPCPERVLPRGVAPGRLGPPGVVVYALLQVVSQVYFTRSGLMQLPGFEFTRRRTT